MILPKKCLFNERRIRNGTEKEKQSKTEVQKIEGEPQVSSFPIHHEIAKTAYGIANIIVYKIVKGIIKPCRRIFFP